MLGRRGKIALVGASAVAILAVVLMLGWWGLRYTMPLEKLFNGVVSVERWDKVRGRYHVLVGPGQQKWTQLESISKYLQYAIIASEDTRFYQHRGLDWNEVMASIETNIKERRYARGASTITQQVVRLAFLSQEKTLLRKLREASAALAVEERLGKDRILEWYLNLVEFGSGVLGVEEAARHFFDTEPQLLNIEQSINLALILPSPNSWSEGLKRERLTEFGRKRFRRILQEMYNLGFITDKQLRHEMATGDFGWPLDHALKMEQSM